MRKNFRYKLLNTKHREDFLSLISDNLGLLAIQIEKAVRFDVRKTGW